MNFFKTLLIGTLIVLSPISNAGLMGDTILVERQFLQWTQGSIEKEVKSGVEIPYFEKWSFDFNDYGLRMTPLSNIGYASGFNGFVFSSLDFGLSNELLSSVTSNDIEQSRISFTDDSFQVDFSWLGFAQNKAIDFSFGTTSVAVPEPNNVALLIFCLLGLVIRQKGTSNNS